jgi:hypothetical protein
MIHDSSPAAVEDKNSLRPEARWRPDLAVRRLFHDVRYMRLGQSPCNLLKETRGATDSGQANLQSHYDDDDDDDYYYY